MVEAAAEPRIAAAARRRGSSLPSSSRRVPTAPRPANSAEGDARRRREQGGLIREGQGPEPRRQAAGDIELNDAVFGLEPRADILHRVVTWQLENRRGTARAARERSDVARTGKKFGRQKGGGTARHGDRRAPIFIGGGKAHGARVREFEQSLNKKVRALGLKMALSAKAQGRPGGRRQPRAQGRQDQGAQGRLGKAAGTQGSGDRRRRGRRRLRAPPATCAGSTCCRRSAPTSTTS